MNIPIETIEKLLEKHGRYLDMTAEEYSEPGYSKDHAEGMILFANWNDIPEHIMTYIEKNHTIEWSDEWMSCQECGGAVRSQADCWEWTSSYYIFNECEVVCHECIEGDKDLQTSYLSELIDQPNRCNLLIDLKDFGFEEIECGYESGWHPGQNDDPKHILKAAQKQMPDKEFVFGDMTTSQFSVEFCLYARTKRIK